MECRVVPINDPGLIIQWFLNGKPLAHGHRFKTMMDFGYVYLDILYAYPEDSGTYTCKAINQLGQAETQCAISVSCKLSFQTLFPLISFLQESQTYAVCATSKNSHYLLLN